MSVKAVLRHHQAVTQIFRDLIKRAAVFPKLNISFNIFVFSGSVCACGRLPEKANVALSGMSENARV